MISSEICGSGHIVKSAYTQRMYGDRVLMYDWKVSEKYTMTELVFDSISMSRTYKERLSLPLGRTRNLLLQNHYQYKKKSKDGEYYYEISKTQTNEQSSSSNANEIEWKIDDDNNDGRNEVSRSYSNSSEMSIKNDLATMPGYRKIDNCVDLDLFVACVKDIFENWMSLNHMQSFYGVHASNKRLNIRILANDIFDQNGQLFALKTNV